MVALQSSSTLRCIQAQLAVGANGATTGSQPASLVEVGADARAAVLQNVEATAEGGYLDSSRATAFHGLQCSLTSGWWNLAFFWSACACFSLGLQRAQSRGMQRWLMQAASHNSIQGLQPAHVHWSMRRGGVQTGLLRYNVPAQLDVVLAPTEGSSDPHWMPNKQSHARRIHLLCNAACSSQLPSHRPQDNLGAEHASDGRQHAVKTTGGAAHR